MSGNLARKKNSLGLVPNEPPKREAKQAKRKSSMKKPGAVSFATNANDDDSSSVSYTAGTYGDGEIGIAGLTAQITELIKENTQLAREVESLQQESKKHAQLIEEKDQTIEQFAAGLRENMEMLEQLEEIEEEAKRMTRMQERAKTKEVKTKLKQTINEKVQLKTELEATKAKVKELEDKLALASTAAAATAATTTALAVAKKNGNDNGVKDKDREAAAALAAAKAAQMAAFVKEMQGVSDLLLAKIAHYSAGNGQSPSTALSTTNGKNGSKNVSAVDKKASSGKTSTELVVAPLQVGRGKSPTSAASSGIAKLRKGVRKVTMINQFTKKKFNNWSSTLRRIDPRYQILEFFDEVAEKGTSALNNCNVHITGECTMGCLDKDLIKAAGVDFGESAYFGDEREARLASSVFNRAGVFTVWRPTSLDSIRKMIVGDGVGKGLDIKGKSAKKGQFSGFVPYLQLHEERHKSMTRSIPVDARMRIFYSTKEMRDEAHKSLLVVAVEMLSVYTKSRKTIDKLKAKEAHAEAEGEVIPEEEAAEDDRLLQDALDKWMWDIEDPEMYLIDDYAPQKYGIDLAQRLFFEAYVNRGECSRPKGSIHETGRLSEPAFQDMNNETLRKPAQPGSPRPVVLLKTEELDKAMDPRYLLIAYEELGTVKPVVSDFDCFLVGTRRVKFEKPLPQAQIDMVKWCLEMIERILELPPSNESWTMRWLEGLKDEYEKGFHVAFPKYGFADPKSYSIMGHAVQRLSGSGSVRHGAECFNYYFPQELDEEFLVVTRDQPNGPWQKFSRDGLLKFLSQKADEGFMFPVNPKWILCDGWKDLYDKQMLSDNPTTRAAVNAWYPPGSGIREMIEGIAARHPQGFRKFAGPYKMENKTYSPLRQAEEAGEEIDACEAINMAEMELEHDRVLRKAIKAVNAVLFANRMNRMTNRPSLSGDQQKGERSGEGKEAKVEKAQEKPPSAMKAKPASAMKNNGSASSMEFGSDKELVARLDSSNGEIRLDDYSSSSEEEEDLEADMIINRTKGAMKKRLSHEPTYKPTAMSIEEKVTRFQEQPEQRVSMKARMSMVNVSIGSVRHLDTGSDSEDEDQSHNTKESDKFKDGSDEVAKFARNVKVVSDQFAGEEKDESGKFEDASSDGLELPYSGNGRALKGILKAAGRGRGRGSSPDIFADADDDGGDGGFL